MNHKVKQNKKIFSAVLLVTLVGMTFSAVFPSQCPVVNGCNNAATDSKMACCSTPATYGGVSISAKCCCNIGSAGEAEAPAVYLTGTLHGAEKRLEEDAASVQPDAIIYPIFNAFSGVQPRLSYYPKFSTHLKIYEFVESYLI